MDLWPKSLGECSCEGSKHTLNPHKPNCLHCGYILCERNANHDACPYCGLTETDNQLDTDALEKATKANLLLVSCGERLFVKEEACDASDWRWQSVEDWERSQKGIEVAELKEKQESRKVDMSTALRFKKK